LELYKHLDKLGERVAYCDTDSIIYVADLENPSNNLETGSFMGQLTNELQIPGDHIKEFISGGPKNYGFKTVKGEECLKVKGFCLNYINKQAFTFENMKNVILNFMDVEPHFEACEEGFRPSRITPPSGIQKNEEKRQNQR